mmetsp:Transcript_20462/g.57659  ORF Transcript_20462/g.57659 Transcript_20462/m.57659 type:complete len:233 (-) Transcript_20462:466-1164(-)
MLSSRWSSKRSWYRGYAPRAASRRPTYFSGTSSSTSRRKSPRTRSSSYATICSRKPCTRRTKSWLRVASALGPRLPCSPRRASFSRWSRSSKRKSANRRSAANGAVAPAATTTISRRILPDSPRLAAAAAAEVVAAAAAAADLPRSLRLPAAEVPLVAAVPGGEELRAAEGLLVAEQPVAEQPAAEQPAAERLVAGVQQPVAGVLRRAGAAAPHVVVLVAAELRVAGLVAAE